MRLPSTDGIELTVHDLGGSGHDALLCHATGFHGLIWRPLAAHLHGLRCFAPDLRGHGASITPPGQAFAWDRFADDVLACVDGLELDRPIGIGHSKGGAALLLAEQRRPGTFAGLWLYEPVVFPTGPRPFGDGENPLAAGARRRRATFDSAASALENFASKPPMAAFDPDARAAYVEHGFAPNPDGTVTLRCRPEDEAAIYEMGGQHHAFDHLGEIMCPVVVARGRTDEPGPGMVADVVADALPHGRLEAHDDLNHFGPMIDPVGLAASIDRFTAGIRA
ncbi:MAG: putative hydrolase or acyltransferase of alpha/beta superfamily [Acidimicrobiales bacterium]|nr:putative hydrolase or acyltransferase of alpha/beta superfamily [Acidimicrobiales bacterium]